MLLTLDPQPPSIPVPGPQLPSTPCAVPGGLHSPRGWAALQEVVDLPWVEQILELAQHPGTGDRGRSSGWGVSRGKCPGFQHSPILPLPWTHHPGLPARHPGVQGPAAPCPSPLALFPTTLGVDEDQEWVGVGHWQDLHGGEGSHEGAPTPLPCSVPWTHLCVHMYAQRMSMHVQVHAFQWARPDIRWNRHHPHPMSTLPGVTKAPADAGSAP